MSTSGRGWMEGTRVKIESMESGPGVEGKGSSDVSDTRSFPPSMESKYHILLGLLGRPYGYDRVKYVPFPHANGHTF